MAEFEGIAYNAITNQQRIVEMSEDEVRDITFDIEFDSCSGPCKCHPLESDGTCSKGWPSKMQAVGLI